MRWKMWIMILPVWNEGNFIFIQPTNQYQKSLCKIPCLKRPIFHRHVSANEFSHFFDGLGIAINTTIWVFCGNCCPKLKQQSHDCQTYLLTFRFGIFKISAYVKKFCIAIIPYFFTTYASSPLTISGWLPLLRPDWPTLAGICSHDAKGVGLFG